MLFLALAAASIAAAPLPMLTSSGLAIAGIPLTSTDYSGLRNRQHLRGSITRREPDLFIGERIITSEPTNEQHSPCTKGTVYKRNDNCCDGPSFFCIPTQRPSLHPTQHPLKSPTELPLALDTAKFTKLPLWDTEQFTDLSTKDTSITEVDLDDMLASMSPVTGSYRFNK